MSLLGMLLLGACGSNCQDHGSPPHFIISVRDSMTGAPLCNADVKVYELPVPAREDCTYYHALDYAPAAQAMEITASNPGYQSKTVIASTTYREDECGKPRAIKVLIQLDPVS